MSFWLAASVESTDRLRASVVLRSPRFLCTKVVTVVTNRASSPTSSRNATRWPASIDVDSVTLVDSLRIIVSRLASAVTSESRLVVILSRSGRLSFTASIAPCLASGRRG